MQKKNNNNNIYIYKFFFREIRWVIPLFFKFSSALFWGGIYLVVNHVIIKNCFKSNLKCVCKISSTVTKQSRLKHFFSSSALVWIFITESGYQASKSNGMQVCQSINTSLSYCSTVFRKVFERMLTTVSK